MFIIDTIRCYIYAKQIKKFVREYGVPKQSENNLSIPSLDELMQKTKKELTDRA